MQRNVTVCLDEETIAKARVVAAKRRTSLSGLLVYAEAKAAALRRMARGAHLGGGRLPARESLHDR
jgi:hypothetical protein